MKVHIVHHMDDAAFCGHTIDYNHLPEDEGWCRVVWIEDYDKRMKNFVWKWCEECLTSSEYGLFLLGEVG